MAICEHTTNTHDQDQLAQTAQTYMVQTPHKDENLISSLQVLHEIGCQVTQLAASSGSHALQLCRILSSLERQLVDQLPRIEVCVHATASPTAHT